MSGVTETPQPSSPPPALAVGAAVFVWGLWVLTLLAALAFVGKYGSNIPYSDDWMLVPALTGEQAVTSAWLWEQYADHRVPVPKLTLLALYHLAGRDLRAVMVFNVLALGTLAFAMIRTAQRLRGWTSYADAFFPLALLHVGQAHNLILSFQVQFILSTVLAGTVLVVMLRT